MLGLRMKEGVSLSESREIAAQTPKRRSGSCSKNSKTQASWRERTAGFFLSEKGTLLANQVLAKFV